MHEKDVLFLCQFFYPEYNSSATLPWDTAKYLAASGFTVDALCGYPKEYNKSGKVPVHEAVERVKINRLHYIQLKRGKKLSRLINYFSFTVTVLLHIGKLRKYKCVIVYSNPPVLPVAAVIGNILFGTKIISVSYDVYPEVAFVSGQLLRGGIIDKVMTWINSSLFKRVSSVVALTDEMKEFLLKNRAALTRNRVTVIPNWAHESTIPSSTAIYEKFEYDERDFIVSYFGNMGICQDMDTLVEAMHKLKDESHIKFLIIGHGGKKEEVAEKIKDLKNVQMLEFMTGREFEEAVCVSSCSIVSLINGIKGMCAPSKYYSYLQGGIPVIAVVESGSYLELEILQERIGGAVLIGDSSGLAKLIKRMAAEPEQQKAMSVRAKELYERKYDRHISLQKYARLVHEVTGVEIEK